MSAELKDVQAAVLPRRRCIVGTAGHIDHGKSALVLALTGSDPDRLPEERKRGMTIELGFAHLVLPSESGDPIHVGIVDVPGHERFVRTMVAGATGLDLGLLVVAADDGVMPQTREHVEILDLLGVESGLIAISKADLVHSDQMDAVLEEIAELVAGSCLRDWPVIATSAKSGEGLDELRSTLAELISDLPSPESSSVFRMAIDRVFAVRGRGTVVTGSVLSGRARVGEALDLQPPGLGCKVRELQSYGVSAEDVAAGQRAALNLTGIDRERIERGMELSTSGYLMPTRYLDARVRILPRQDKAFPTHRRIRMEIGTTEVMATLVVVGGSQIQPGSDALAQLRLARPIVASFGQRFIIRDENACATLGGGRVVRPVSRRFRPHQRGEEEALEQRESPDAFVRYNEAIRQAGFETWTPMRVACEIGVPPDAVAALSDRLRGSDQLIRVGGSDVHARTVEAVEQRTLAYLRRHHADHPTEPGVLRDRLVGWIKKRSAAGWGSVILKRLLKDSRATQSGPYIADAGFRPALSPEDAALAEKLIAEIAAAQFDVPVMPKLKTVAALSRPRAKMLDDLAKCEPRLVSVGPQHFLTTEAMDRFTRTIRELAARGPFKLADVRDALDLSRRVVQPLLEHLDRVGVTKRVGDERVLLEADA